MQSKVIRRKTRLGTVRLLSSLFPEPFGRIGAKHFLEPHTTRPSQRWSHAFDGFERRTVEVAGEKIPLWLKGKGPAVLLVHGWQNDHYSMGGFVEPLVAQGYSVVTLDLPAHGLATERRAPLPLMAEAIATVGRETGPLHAIIAHSVGGAMSVLAMEEYGLQAQRLVLIGAPQAAQDQAVSQGRAQGLSQLALKHMATRIHQALGAPLERFRTDLGLSQLQTAVMLVHAKDDAIVPIDAALHNAAACQAKTLWLEAGGHNRPLGDERVIQAICSFLKVGIRRNRFPAALRHPPGTTPIASRWPGQTTEAVDGGAAC